MLDVTCFLQEARDLGAYPTSLKIRNVYYFIGALLNASGSAITIGILLVLSFIPTSSMAIM